MSICSVFLMMFTTDIILRVMHENDLHLEELKFTCMFFIFFAKTVKNTPQLNPGISYTISTVSKCMCHFSPTFAHWNNLSFHPTKTENSEAGLLCRGL